MEISKSIFREYDIRGIYPEQINEEVVQKIAKAISVKCLNEGVSEICIARDGRLSGEKLLSALANSLSDNGIDVINTGMATTPLLYFAAKKSASKSGVMITGSHNPKSYNGIKLIINDKPVSGTEIYNLMHRIHEVSERKGKITFRDFKDEYISEIKKNIVLKDKLKVVIDCGNGASGCVAPRLYSELGCDVVNLYTEIDGNFPNHHPDPGKPENLIDLIKKVKETHADLGLAFDGDGDRVGLVTADGEIVFPDKILMMLCKDILSSSKGKIIYDVKCTDSLPRLIKDYGGIVSIMPKYAIVLMIFTLGAVGLPGTSGFVGEFLILMGAFKKNFLVATIASIGVILCAAYMLWLYKRVIFGDLLKTELKTLADINKTEIFILTSLVVPIVLFGFYPEPILNTTELSIRDFIETYKTNINLTTNK